MRPVWPVHVHTLAGAAGAWFIQTRISGVPLLKFCTTSSFLVPMDTSTVHRRMVGLTRVSTARKVRVSVRIRVRLSFWGAGILRNAESCQGVICGKSSPERSANYPLSLIHISEPTRPY